MAIQMKNVTDVKPGDVLADTVISVKGKVLLGKDIVLTAKHISLLDTWDVQSVFIKTDDGAADEELPSANAALEQGSLGEQAAEPEAGGESDSRIKSTQYFQFTQQRDQVVQNLAEDFGIVRDLQLIPVSQIKNVAASIHLSLNTYSFEAMNYLLLTNRQFADMISCHSVMVAYFSELIARKLKWNDEDISGVALAGLLHDIGSVIVKRPGELKTQTHLIETAGLLKKARGLSNEVILGIVQHRERLNGSGFPTKAKEGQIHPYARIIAVADLFHNLAYDEKGTNPFPALDKIAVERFDQFDVKVCMAFLEQIKDSLLFNKVLLTNGETAQIVFFHPDSYGMPVVKTEQGQFIDLAQSRNISIRKIIVPSLLKQEQGS